MLSPELLIVSTLKALVEIAALSLLAQGIVGLMSGRAKQENFIYRLFQIVTAPIIRITRVIMPGFITDRHMALTSFFILFCMWVALIFAKGYVCHTQHLSCVPN